MEQKTDLKIWMYINSPHKYTDLEKQLKSLFFLFFSIVYKILTFFNILL